MTGADARRRKNELRRRIRAELAALPPDELQSAASAICPLLIESEAFRRARVLMFFYPTGHEIDLSLAADHAHRAGRTICYPRMDWDARTMIAVEVPGADHRTEVRRFGVPEPAKGKPVPPHDIDLVLLPGLAFDRTGGRLGRGAGFYDRFLSTLRETPGRATACGVCLARQILPEGRTVPRDEWDEPLDALLCETGFVSPLPGGTG